VNENLYLYYCFRKELAEIKQKSAKWVGFLRPATLGLAPGAQKNKTRKTTYYPLFASKEQAVCLVISISKISEERHMSAQAKMETTTGRIPAEINTKLRGLAHDLSNSIETIMQASYLLAQCNLEENPKKWSELIDQATREAARINREIREILRASA
jgi:nitrogen-specific signal transduction histidine kinase